MHCEMHSIVFAGTLLAKHQRGVLWMTDGSIARRNAFHLSNGW